MFDHGIVWQEQICRSEVMSIVLNPILGLIPVVGPVNIGRHLIAPV